MLFGSSPERETKEDSSHNDVDVAAVGSQHVTVIQSSNPSRDKAAFENYFGFEAEQDDENLDDEDGGYEQQNPSSKPIILTRDRHSVVLLPVSSTFSPPPPSSSASSNMFSVLILEEPVLTKAKSATDSTTSEGLPKAEWHSFSIKPRNDYPIDISALKIILSTGHVLVATTSLGWKIPSARAKLLQYVQLRPPTSPTSTDLKPSLPTEAAKSSQAPSVTPASNTFSSSNGDTNQRMFPSLDIKCRSLGGDYTPFEVNAQLDVPVETDLFVGSMILILRPEDPAQDPYWNGRIFSKKKRRVIMLLQGKLKYTPNGPLFAGMEISQPMQLGLMASGLCNLILKFIQGFDPNMHYSFGDNLEKAHMTGLAETFFDQLIVTPPGEPVPKLSGELKEPPEIVKSRKALKTRIQWNTEDTYTMAFHTMYIDLPSWTTSNIPLVRNMKLQTFWANSLLKIVLYEPDQRRYPTRHATEDIRYVMSVQLKYLQVNERENTADAFWPTNSSEEGDGGNSSVGSWGDLTLDENQSSSFREEKDSEENEEFFDTVQIHSDSGSLLNLPPTVDASFSPAFVLSIIDEYCPFIIEMHSAKKGYETVYAFRGRYSHSRPIFRDLETAKDALADCRPSVNEDWLSPRLTDIERRRRILALTYVKGLSDKDVEIQQRTFAFQTMKSTYDRKFLKAYIPKKKKEKTKQYFAVARALSDHHWVEERALLTDHNIEFFHIDKKKSAFQIGLANIIELSDVESGNMLQGYYSILSIETFGRTTYLMFPSKEERTRWSIFIKDRAKAKNGLMRNDTLMNRLINVDDPAREFLHRSTMFDCSKRKILNCRRFTFQAPKPTCSQDTLWLAERALFKATNLQSAGSNDSALMDFLNCVSALKDANAHDLNEDERLAFFLNIYHVVIMHAFLVLGPPKNGLEWLTYFNGFAYQCSDDVFSLTELEHNIIRAKMNYPSQFFSRFVLPKSQFSFALMVPDVRINFALNSGSLSMPSPAVPIYQADTLNEQLDETVLKFV